MTQDKPDGTSEGNGGNSATASPAAPRRGPHARHADMRDTVAELAERAQVIKQEAGSKVAASMKDVISAAAGIAGFAVESARDLVQYMVRRGQMTPEEAEKLMQQAEAAHARRPASERTRPTASKVAADKAAAAKPALPRPAPAKPALPKPVTTRQASKPAKTVRNTPAAKKASPAKVPKPAAPKKAAPAKPKTARTSAKKKRR